MSGTGIAPRGLCYSYVRMSTELQARGGDSLRRQTVLVERFAKLHGLRLAPPMRDLGISAFRGKHRQKGALGPFLTAIKHGEIEPGTLVIEAIDRLSREVPTTILGLLTDILNAGFVIHLLSTGQTFDHAEVNKPNGILENLVGMAKLAHLESKLKSERITEAYEDRRAQARAGTRLKGNYHPTWIDRHYDGDTVTHTVNEDAAATIRMIFDLAQSGMGAHMIAKTLNARKVPHLPAPSLRRSALNKERRWYQSHIGRLLSDRRVLGEYQPFRLINGKDVPEGEPIEHHFPAVITPEVFLAVKKARDPRLGRKTGARNTEFSNLFTNGLAVCGHCGERMLIRGDYRKGVKTTRHYLRCARHSTGSTCDNHRTPRYQWFEKKVLDALPDVPWTQLLKMQKPECPIEALERAIAENEAESERLNRASTRLLKLIEAEDEPDPEVMARRRTIAAERKVLKNRHADLIIELNEARTADKEIHLVGELAVLRHAMATPNDVERAVIRQKMHAILARIIERAMFYQHHAQVNIRGGLCLTVPLDEDGPVETGWFMDPTGSYGRQTGANGIPPMKPAQDGRTLVAKAPK